MVSAAARGQGHDRLADWSYAPGMRAVRRVSAVLVLVVVGLMVGAGPAEAAPGESISSYDTRLALTGGGSLQVTETIAYDFGSNMRHGIIRQIPVRFRYDDSHDRVYPVSAISVTQDDGSVPVDQFTSGSFLTLKIGDPDRTITGEHRYVISYTVTGALNNFPDHQELFWNAVGTEWTVPIAQAAARVTGPAEIQRVGCFAGPRGSQLSCTTSSTQGDVASFAQADLAAGEGLTVVAAFPPGTFRDTAPVLERRRDLASAFEVTPLTLAGVVVALLLGLAGVLFALWRFGRDRYYLGQLPGLTPGPGEADVQRRRPLIGGPPVSVEFVPPDRIKPGQVGTLIDEQANVIDVTATIVDFAVRRHLLIRELPPSETSKQDWELTKLSDGDPNFLEYERILFDALFNGRDRVRLSQLRNTFAV